MNAVLRWNPYPEFDLSALEGWLDRLAREGLTVRVWLGPLALCRRGQAHPSRRFRIQPACTRESASYPPERGLMELYQEAGWTYWRNCPGGLGFLFYTDRPDAPEPYTDPESKAMALDGLRRRFRWDVIRTLAGFFLEGLYCFLLFPKVHSGDFTLPTPVFLFFLFYGVLVLLLSIQEWRGMERTCRRLEEGEANPLPPARKLGLLKGAVELSALFLWLLCTVLVVILLHSF